MPALDLFGRSLLIAPDDFWTFMWVFIILHPFWAWLDLQDLTYDTEEDATKAGVSQVLIQLDLGLCMATVPIDILITITSAWGPIMRPRKCEGFLKCLLYLRILFIVVLVPLLGYTCVPTTQWLAENWKDRKTGETAWYDIFKGAMLLVRLAFYLYCLTIVLLVIVPKSLYKGALSLAANLSLKLVGAREDVFHSMVRLMMKVFHDKLNLDLVAPTDILYGIFLVMGHQQQGPLGPDPDLDWKELQDEEKRMLKEETVAGEVEQNLRVPRSVFRASSLKGVKRPLTQLSSKSEVDGAAMGEITYLMPFASGIYGPVLFGLPAKGFEEGSMCPRRPCWAYCSALPCWQRLRSDLTWCEWLRRRCCCLVPPCCCCGYDGKTEGDWCCGTNEDFMVDAVRQPCMAEGRRVPELLWASWRTEGHGKALPMSVFRDDERKQFIFTVRGTADLKSIVDDAGVEPVFWDPLDMAGPDANREPPFDDQKDYFVPDVWLSISIDCIRILKEKGLLRQVLGSPDFRVLVTGHSLGAGVATLIALQLRRDLPEQTRVHYLGFEPPGCSLSPLLSKATQEMGWLSVVCAHDWVPRLSIRNIEKLRELALDALEQCDRSKMQLCVLLCAGCIDRVPFVPRCLRRLFSYPLESLAGGPLGRGSSNCCAYRDLEPLKIARQPEQFPLMLPAGDVVFLRPVMTTWVCGLFQKDTEWSGEWADPVDVQQEFILAPRVMDLHVPWVYEHAVGRVSRRFTPEKVAEGRPFEQQRMGGRRRAAVEP